MPTTQLKITLPIKLQGYIRSKAEKYGLTMSAYVRNLIVNDVKTEKTPNFLASGKTIKAYQQAKKLEKANQLEKTENLDKFFKQL